MDLFCCLCFASICVILSSLFLASLWSPAGAGGRAVLSDFLCVVFSCVLSLSHMVFRVTYMLLLHLY